MEALLLLTTMLSIVYCLYTGFPVIWMRKNGYVKYRIIFTTKYTPTGVYVLQESCLGIIWHNTPFDPEFWDSMECGNIVGTESEKLEDVRKYKKWIETKIARARQERKRKKVTKIIE